MFSPVLWIYEHQPVVPTALSPWLSSLVSPTPVFFFYTSRSFSPAPFVTRFVRSIRRLNFHSPCATAVQQQSIPFTSSPSFAVSLCVNPISRMCPAYRTHRTAFRKIRMSEKTDMREGKRGIIILTRARSSSIENFFHFSFSNSLLLVETKCAMPRAQFHQFRSIKL